MDIYLTLLIPNSMMLGWQYYEPEKGFNFHEFNICLFFFQIELRWGKNL
jgi:hypothetical protein